MNAVSNFFNQNFYGFCILLMAAFFYYRGLNEAGATFFGAGAALMGVRQQPANTVTTTSTVQATPEIK
jgi:hypothetical protein